MANASYTTPTAPTAAANVALNVAGDITNPWQGLVDEHELRDGYGWLNGVMSGGVCTSNGTTVSVESIAAFVSGKRYSGASTYDMTGSGAATYYLVIDSGDDTTPIAAQTGTASSTQLTLCSLVFDGTSITSINDNVKVKGLLRRTIDVVFPGTITTGSKAVIPMTENYWLEDMWVQAVDNGSGTQFTMDALLGPNGEAGTTVFTTTGNRPTVLSTTADYTISKAGEPDGDRNPDKNEHITLLFDEANDAANVTATLILRKRD